MKKVTIKREGKPYLKTEFYDDDNNLLRRTLSLDEDIIEQELVERDDNGNIIKIIIEYKSGKTNQEIYNYKYNDKNEVICRTKIIDGVEDSSIHYKYEYNEDGTKVAHEYSYCDGIEQCNENTITYDKNGKIIAEHEHNKTTLYEYNEDGNLINRKLLTNPDFDNKESVLISIDMYAYNNKGDITKRVTTSNGKRKVFRVYYYETCYED